ncbi:MAG: C4-type zinc ribbon domain-containing protein [Caldilineaceae bacterium]
MADVAKLYELQKIDITSLKVRRRLGELKSLLTESEALQSARSQAELLQQELQQWQVKQKNDDLEIQSLAGRIQETEKRLMSGQVRNPKELEALQSSLEALQRLRSEVETASVEALIKVEELTGEVTKANAKLQQVKKDWSTEQGELAAEDTKLKRAYLQLKKQRELTAAALDRTLLDQYEHLRQRKGGIALATLQNETCSACHVQVPTGVLSSVRSHPDTLIYCTSCGRLLYAP